MPLNSYLSLNGVAYEDDEDSNLLDIFNAHQIEDPLDSITKKEYYKTVESAIDKSLSTFEKQVLDRYMQGESYVQIAEKLDTPVKSIDNAIQRIRKKAIKSINAVKDTIDNHMPVDIIEIYLKQVLADLGKITGDDISEDIINEIFSKFCLGK